MRLIAPAQLLCAASIALFTLAAPAAQPPEPLTARASGSAYTLPLLAARHASSHDKRDAPLTGDDLVLAHLAEGQAIERKYGLASRASSSSHAKRAAQESIPIAGNQLVFYTAISVGTPPVTYEVGLDTGSSDLVLITQDPRRKACAPGTALFCKITASFYNPDISSTAVKTDQATELTYGTAFVEALLVRDTVTLAGFTNPSQEISAAWNATSLVSSADQTGLIGLGWQSLSVSNSTPVLQAAWERGELAEPVFAFGFADLSKEIPRRERISPGGTLTVGGTNSSHYSGDIHWIPLAESKYWSIPLEDITIGTTTIPSISLGVSAPKAIIDTGSNLIGLPEDIAARIYAQIPGAFYYYGLYLYPCRLGVNLAFRFAGVEYALTPAAHNRGSYNSTTCIGAVFPLAVNSTDSDAIFLLGTPLLFNLYNAYRFDPPAVGFAQLAADIQLTDFRNQPIPTSNGTNFSPVPVSSVSARATAVTAAGGGGTTSGAERRVREWAIGSLVLSLAAGAALVLI